MQVDITNFLNESVKPLVFTEEFAIPSEYHLLADTLLAHVNANLTLTDEFLLTGALDAICTVACARCLKPTEYRLHFPICETFVDAQNMKKDSDAWVFTGKTIDFTPTLLSLILLNLPSKILCVDSCKGLCSVCGSDLNLLECGCERVHIDSRWETLRSVMSEKEV